ncbi:BamA/TamA family outer membrane protein [Flavobacterium caeni]|uniref:Surface antigen n=1 Tax=Flavobacterium caeni TaxID=490189 RepID=A0A1G5CIC8_9FLAO|nr:hypothetical protein [Flavobacterium caeni]SCY02163.1 hypothetical protein SAMN02927903_00549 [Flavobacterium caeni]
MSKRFLVFLLIFGCLQPMLGQTKKDPKTAKDSVKMYRNIENYSQKRGFTRFLHKLVFKPVTAKPKVKKSNFQKIKKRGYAAAEGKIIRDINVATLDPFGYSEIDSTRKPNRWVFKAGNALHNKTNAWAIKDLLLIKRNKPLDSLLLLESARLIRSQRYVRAVDIYTKAPHADSDSVDVYIRVLDSWSLIPDFAFSGSRVDLELNERNFMGTGHQFRNSYKKEVGTDRFGYSTLYHVPNILNTYVQTSVSYQIDLDDNYSKFASIERPFFSPYARWAAGIYFDQQYRRVPMVDSLGIETFDTYKYNTQDYWAGHAYQIFKGSSEKSRTTNLITSLRFLQTDYVMAPASDSVGFFSDERFYMASVGISSRQFVQDKFLFNYAVVEDVPTGIVYGITAGFQEKNSRTRFYLGGRFSYGKYFKFGYLGTDIEYGSFHYQGNEEQTAMVYKLIYFTNLFETTRWKFRYFVKPELIIGNRREPTDADRLSLNEERGIHGFNAPVFGTKKLLVTLQSQGYSPWKFWGFRMNPYLSATFGMLGDAEHGLRKSRLYSQFGAGIIISNDYLVFSSFQLSFSYYPTIPFEGTNIIKTNAYNTEDFKLQDFDISKPRTVPYQ